MCSTCNSLSGYVSFSLSDSGVQEPREAGLPVLIMQACVDSREVFQNRAIPPNNNCIAEDC